MAALGCNAWRGRTFVADHQLKDTMISGDAVQTLNDVTSLTCARECASMFPCGFFAYNPADRTCALCSKCTNMTMTNGPGYQMYTSAVSTDSSPEDETNLCSVGALTPQGCWKPTELTYLTHVSVGPAGVWGVNAPNQKIYFRSGTYQDPSAFGSWELVSGYLFQADVGSDFLLSTNLDNYMLYRWGINSLSPSGSVWSHLLETVYQWASVSPRGNVWAVNTTGHLLRSRDSATALSGSTIWDATAADMQRVDAGRAGVWALDNGGHLYYRNGTYGDHYDSTATGDWLAVAGHQGTFISVSAATDLVATVDSAGHVWLRSGLSTETPTGLAWVQFPGVMKQVEIYEAANVAALWAVDFNDQPYFSLLAN